IVLCGQKCDSYKAKYFFKRALVSGIGKADIRNPLLLLAHEHSRFATCHWNLRRDFCQCKYILTFGKKWIKLITLESDVVHNIALFVFIYEKRKSVWKS
uniref:hypothetical protein n=1 Tax=uncultured Eubacterium sp. TaxID=165185 RepID=UPI0025DADD26